MWKEWMVASILFISVCIALRAYFGLYGIRKYKEFSVFR